MPASAPILHINGWAGSGKRTIAAALAAQTGARLIDNHALLNPVQALYDRDNPRAPGFRQALRYLIFAELRTLPDDTKLIFTDALADDAYCRGLFDDVRSLAADRGASLTSVILEIEAQENMRRLTDAARAPLRKLRDPNVLQHLRQTEQLLQGPADQTIHLEVTTLSAEDSADALAAKWLAKGT